MSDIERVVEWLASLGGRTSNEYARAIQALSARAEAAEAEVERLRAALHSITLSYDERCGIDHATLARSALEAKP